MSEQNTPRREIKFRVWDTVTKRMSPSFVLFGEMLLMGLIHGWQEHEEREAGITLEKYDSLIRLNDLEIMQFTGLRDKNGKEIYEGDIVHVVHPYKCREFTGPIEWLDYKFGSVQFYFPHYDYPLDIFEDTRYIEVIGNIYQPPIT